MEMLDLMQFQDIYRGKRVLVTGTTGFKGSWLTLWLQELGAHVIGISLAPNSKPNHWGLLKPTIDNLTADIRQLGVLNSLVQSVKPEIVFHLAAQPLVRQSYADPIETWSTNVLGTANVLESCRCSPSVRAVVVVTTDKCYQNIDSVVGYRETDRLGGYDPYSASKAASELLVDSYRRSFFSGSDSALIASARAGNVIGGGDWSADRLIPDVVRAVQAVQSLEVRSPNAIRPWQHVLESLSGYLLLGQKLLEGNDQMADAWNFGPAPTDTLSVAEVLTMLQNNLRGLNWHISCAIHPHEAQMLVLDSSKAREELGWTPTWDLKQAISKTALWYDAWLASGEVLSQSQLNEYVTSAKVTGKSWVA